MPAGGPAAGSAAGASTAGAWTAGASAGTARTGTDLPLASVAVWMPWVEACGSAANAAAVPASTTRPPIANGMLLSRIMDIPRVRPIWGFAHRNEARRQVVRGTNGYAPDGDSATQGRHRRRRTTRSAAVHRSVVGRKRPAIVERWKVSPSRGPVSGGTRSAATDAVATSTPIATPPMAIASRVLEGPEELSLTCGSCGHRASYPAMKLRSQRIV